MFSISCKCQKFLVILHKLITIERKNRNVIESIENSFPRNLLFAGYQKYHNKNQWLLMLKKT